MARRYNRNQDPTYEQRLQAQQKKQQPQAPMPQQTKPQTQQQRNEAEVENYKRRSELYRNKLGFAPTRRQMEMIDKHGGDVNAAMEEYRRQNADERRRLGLPAGGGPPMPQQPQQAPMPADRTAQRGQADARPAQAPMPQQTSPRDERMTQYRRGNVDAQGAPMPRVEPGTRLKFDETEQAELAAIEAANRAGMGYKAFQQEQARIAKENAVDPLTAAKITETMANAQKTVQETAEIAARMEREDAAAKGKELDDEAAREKVKAETDRIKAETDKIRKELTDTGIDPQTAADIAYKKAQADLLRQQAAQIGVKIDEIKGKYDKEKPAHEQPVYQTHTAVIEEATKELDSLMAVYPRTDADDARIEQLQRLIDSARTQRNEFINQWESRRNTAGAATTPTNTAGTTSEAPLPSATTPASADQTEDGGDEPAIAPRPDSAGAQIERNEDGSIADSAKRTIERRDSSGRTIATIRVLKRRPKAGERVPPGVRLVQTRHGEQYYVDKNDYRPGMF